MNKLLAIYKSSNDKPLLWVPDGWQLVPADPTKEMYDAARDWSCSKYGKPIGSDAAAGCWKAMFAAAPKSDTEREQASQAVEADVERDAARFRLLITMLPVGTFNDMDVFDEYSWREAIDAMQSTKWA